MDFNAVITFSLTKLHIQYLPCWDVITEEKEHSGEPVVYLIERPLFFWGFQY